MWFGSSECASGHGGKDKAPGLFGLVFVDFACDLYRGADSDYPGHNKQ
jgi:hypothetical protein